MSRGATISNGGPGSGPRQGNSADEIEGTQKEADREVAKADKVVKSIQKEIAQRMAANPDEKVKSLEKEHAEVGKRLTGLKADLEATKARIAALKAKLKPGK